MDGEILWINGAFGVGKSTLARELARDHGARLFDPEVLGWIVQRTVARGGDYQDARAWREGTRLTLAAMSSLRGRTIVPMTLVVPAYADAILGALSRRGVPVRHVLLTASETTLRTRLEERASDGAWAREQIARCLVSFQEPARLGIDCTVSTDGKTRDEVLVDVRAMLARPPA